MRSILFALFFSMLGLVGACQPMGGFGNKAERPISSKLTKKMKAYGMKASSPIMLRVFKSENVIEVWKQKDNGRFGLLETYEICKWSGKLGPKFKEGDRQAPEGFYTVNKHQMNPKSRYHLSFNIGFPNRYDRVHGRTGSHLMVHGACSSAGCYSMTDERVEEIYALAREAFKGGQKSFQVQAFPFRMTPENMARNVASPHYDFWKMIKEGYDHFNLTKVPPKIDVCEKRYMINRVAERKNMFKADQKCPEVTMPPGLISAYTKLRNEQSEAFIKALASQKTMVTLTGGDASLYDPQKRNLVAMGSEILPPASIPAGSQPQLSPEITLPTPAPNQGRGQAPEGVDFMHTASH